MSNEKLASAPAKRPGHGRICPDPRPGLDCRYRDSFDHGQPDSERLFERRGGPRGLKRTPVGAAPGGPNPATRRLAHQGFAPDWSLATSCRLATTPNVKEALKQGLT